jgi:hypothetical protein
MDDRQWRVASGLLQARTQSTTRRPFFVPARPQACQYGSVAVARGARYFGSSDHLLADGDYGIGASMTHMSARAPAIMVLISLVVVR